MVQRKSSDLLEKNIDQRLDIKRPLAKSNTRFVECTGIILGSTERHCWEFGLSSGDDPLMQSFRHIKSMFPLIKEIELQNKSAN